MKRRRAASSPSSWLCMWASAVASWPSSSREESLKWASKSPCATRWAVLSSRSTRTVSARATSTPVSSATSRPIAAASRIRERTSPTAPLTSLRCAL